MSTARSDPKPHAHLAAALALSNPLRRSDIGLEGLDPAAIARAAYPLGTAPAVVTHLQELGFEGALSDNDRAVYLHTLARNIVALGLADEASAALEERGIRCAAMKGYAMLLDHYGDAGRRRMFDVDLLIDACSFSTAEAILTPLGWRRQLHPMVSSRLNIEAVFVREHGGFETTLELHRRLFFPGRFAFDTRELWRWAHKPASCAPSWRLDPTQTLLYLACHKAQHGYLNDSRDLIDAANIASGGPIAWERLVSTARRWRCRAAARLFIERCQRACAMEVPVGLLDALAHSNRLGHLLPDATLDPDFRQVRNNRRPLGKKILDGLAATDAPTSEAAALAVIACRGLADRAAASLGLSPRHLKWVDAIPMRRSPRG